MLLTPQQAARRMSKRAGYEITTDDLKQLRRYGRIRGVKSTARITLYTPEEVDNAPLPKKRHPKAMESNMSENFLEKLTQKYPERIVRSISLDHSKFQIGFDLPEDHHLSVNVTVVPFEQQLLVYQGAQETMIGRVPYSDGCDFYLPEQDKMVLLKQYLCALVGEGDDHFYEDDLTATVVLTFLKGK